MFSDDRTLILAGVALLVLAWIATRTSGAGQNLSLTAPGLSSGTGATSDGGADIWAAVLAPFKSVSETISAEISTVENYQYSQPSNPRGIRNNNPGNIRHGDNWRGMTASQPDADFITFKAPEYGIRAMGKLLGNYQSLYGLNTVAKIIDRWAPPNENNTGAYANHVAQQLGVGVNEAISVGDRLTQLVPAIIQHENGQQPYSADTIAAGLALI